ncbi:MAG: hypothetical protein F4042_02565 [Gemmatimonadetes bacterium]|nr:hypothetical protein [Gemmatimonadota bacterium]
MAELDRIKDTGTSISNALAENDQSDKVQVDVAEVVHCLVKYYDTFLARTVINIEQSLLQCPADEEFDPDETVTCGLEEMEEITISLMQKLDNLPENDKLPEGAYNQVSTFCSGHANTYQELRQKIGIHDGLASPVMARKIKSRQDLLSLLKDDE